MNDWENPRLLHRGRLPARAYTFPFPDELTAITGEPGASPWLELLNGRWEFTFSIRRPRLRKTSSAKLSMRATGRKSPSASGRWRDMADRTTQTWSTHSPWTRRASLPKTPPVATAAVSGARESGAVGA